jgi:hypothetical protein
VESMWSPLSPTEKNMQFFGVHMESMWSPCRVSMELLSPRGVHENSMGHSKVLKGTPDGNRTWKAEDHTWIHMATGNQSNH